MNYVIIGASAAGLAAAESIRKNDLTGNIKILTDEGYLPYSRPSVSYFLKGKISENDIYLRKNGFYKSNNIEVVTNARVTKIDKEKKEVYVGRKAYPYDKLCLCTGSKPFIPPMKNVEGNKNALTFLDMKATKEIKKLANANTKAVVIGAGLIGMKAAEGLSKICKSVDVVELSDRILPSILDAKSSVSVKKHLEENGIKFHLGNTVVSANAKDKKITSVTLKNGEVIDCDLVVLAVGVRPNTDLAEKAGLKTERGILVNTKTMQTSDKNIYAAGDCCVSVDMLDKNKKIIALWPNAVIGGRVAGSQMSGGKETVEKSYSVNAIDFFGLSICTCGLINAQGEEFKDIVKASGNKYKRLIVRNDMLVGFVLINCSENAGIYTSLISNETPLSTLEMDVAEEPNIFMFDKQTRRQKLTGGVKL